MNTIRYDEKERCWFIQCEPHISMRLRRWFGKLGRQVKKEYAISDSPEAALDLLVFAERFDLEINGSEKRLRARAKIQRDRQRSVKEIIAGRGHYREFELAIPARDYQKAGAQLALDTRGTIIGDDLGLGKTCIGICMLTLPETRPAVVITLAHLTPQWQGEMRLFAPQLKTHIIKSMRPYDWDRESRFWNQDELNFGVKPGHDVFSSNRDPIDVLIISYNKLAQWAETLVERGIKTIILDECQEARRAGSMKYSALKLLADNTEFHLGLSATPIYNYGAEIFNVYDVINPGQLGTRAEFAAEWCRSDNYDERGEIKNTDAFGAFLRQSGLMLRRTRAEVGRELPAITKVPHHIEADVNQIRKFSGQCAELARLILNANGVRSADLGIKESEFSNKLRQATGIAKAPFVAEFVRMLLEGGEDKVLLGGWHRECYRIWMEALKQYEPVMYTGSEDEKHKSAAKALFVNGNSRVMLMSLRSGAGLDGLQGVCKTAVHGELDYSPAVHEQFTGRIWRDGQKGGVVSYYLIADAGSDPIISDILGVKREQFHGIVNVNAPLTNVITDKDYVRKMARSFMNQMNLR